MSENPFMACCICRKHLPLVNGGKSLSVDGACITLAETRRAIVLCSADLERFKALEEARRGVMMTLISSLPSSAGPDEVAGIVRSAIESHEADKEAQFVQ